ncbi:histidine phosphotransferase family protein [Sulfitobacter sp. F26204]|uniref:histidine phosphotransferase family protein n=1 Tax=Sulfitobacter sp. F26204 TaxID=2996014 RepID=UPI00225DD3C7|nr:histidine phosphotransferase family protein [Sulfitobacter sp. F26204]MCX7559743.1 histidine phosphotransferase family protein [Sulfitobacter sp. F26204]
MSDMNSTLAALVGSRICHDLVSPIGAINNGLELLQMSGNPSGPEIGLIGESVDNASARIRFFRVAFGAAGDQMVGADEVRATLGDLYASSRLSPEWLVAKAVPRAEVRLVFLAILCIESALPYGGHIEIKAQGGKWSLTAVADRINVDPPLWALLSDHSLTCKLMPSHVQFALLPAAARDAGRLITCQSDEGMITINF